MTKDSEQSPSQKDDQQYQAASESVNQYMRYPPKNKSKKQLPKKMTLTMVAVIVVLIIGGGTYWLTKHHKATKLTTSTGSTQPKPQTSNSSQTLTYISNGQDLNLDFDYPSDWSVTPASNDNPKDQTITLNSPSATIQSADGDSLTGKVTLQIRPGTDTINELNSNNPVATQSSTQFAYSKPTASQLQYPYLTFIHFANGSKASGAFEEVIITGSQQFTQGEAVTADDLSDLDPIISANFYRCSTTACPGQGSGILSITSSTWSNTTIFSETQSIFNSLQLN